jgi:hypothetical protein
LQGYYSLIVFGSTSKREDLLPQSPGKAKPFTGLTPGCRKEENNIYKSAHSSLDTCTNDTQLGKKP